MNGIIGKGEVKLSKEELFFNRFMEAKSDVQMLATIVQNEGVEVGMSELIEWSGDVSSLIEKIDNIRNEVFDYYYK